MKKRFNSNETNCLLCTKSNYTDNICFVERVRDIVKAFYFMISPVSENKEKRGDEIETADGISG